MPPLEIELAARLVSLLAGLLLLTAVLVAWRLSVKAAIRLLALQGGALAVLVAVIGATEATMELFAVAAVVFGLKAILLPVILAKSARQTGASRETSPLINPTASLLAVAAVTVVAYVVAQPLTRVGPTLTAPAAPVGMALVFIGFLLLATRRRASSALIGFLMIDNGIAVVAFLAAGGVPLVVEAGVLLDVLLIVLILRVLTARMRLKFGGTDLAELSELCD